MRAICLCLLTPHPWPETHVLISACLQDEDTLLAVFSGPTGRFENTEVRDVAKNLDGLVAMLRDVGAREGNVVADSAFVASHIRFDCQFFTCLCSVGAGTGIFLRHMNAAVGSSGHVYTSACLSDFI